jgi:hypothetical protein
MELIAREATDRGSVVGVRIATIDEEDAAPRAQLPSRKRSPSPAEEIGWSRTQEIRWSPSQEIGWVRLEEILHQAQADRPHLSRGGNRLRGLSTRPIVTIPVDLLEWSQRQRADPRTRAQKKGRPTRGLLEPLGGSSLM